MIALILVAVVVAGGLGYWLLTPKMPSETVSYTTEQASSPSPTLRTSQTAASSTASTSASGTTLWINVSATKPVSYYISLLKSTQTQPYAQLAWELQALPDATNATAVAKITYLALNAANPEVREAFELMMKGGTPSPSDFSDFTMVPKYNTELQVLYWLALQNQFKKDDTLALAVATANGLWLTIGDEQVRQAVKKDTSDLLVFFRETDQLQSLKGFQRLERLPLEAKICLAWAGGYSTSGGRPYPLQLYKDRKLPLRGYVWDTVSLQTLRRMRDLMETKGWIVENVDKTVASVERYLYFSTHWNYTGSTETEYIEVDGERVLVHDMNNVDFEFGYFLKNGMGIGDCGDESGLVDAFSKSWGIATTYVMHQSYNNDMTQIIWSHMKISYYEPASNTWRICEEQLNIGIDEPYRFTLYVYRPPVMLLHYLNYYPNPSFRFHAYGNECYAFQRQLSAGEIKGMFLTGIESSKMKQWLLYS